MDAPNSRPTSTTRRVWLRRRINTMHSIGADKQVGTIAVLIGRLSSVTVMPVDPCKSIHELGRRQFRPKYPSILLHLHTGSVHCLHENI